MGGKVMIKITIRKKRRAGSLRSRPANNFANFARSSQRSMQCSNSNTIRTLLGRTLKFGLEIEEVHVTERVTRDSVTFRQPFTLAGMDGVQPPGTYEVETVHERLDGPTFSVYRRVSTTITPDPSGTLRSRQVSTVDLFELEAAVAGDAARSAQGVK
jgi:hypothetical protein